MRVKHDRYEESFHFITTPVSDFKGLASLLPLDALLRLWEPQIWIYGRFGIYECVYIRPLIITPNPYNQRT